MVTGLCVLLSSAAHTQAWKIRCCSPLCTSPRKYMILGSEHSAWSSTKIVGTAHHSGGTCASFRIVVLPSLDNTTKTITTKLLRQLWSNQDKSTLMIICWQNCLLGLFLPIQTCPHHPSIRTLYEAVSRNSV